MKNLLIHFVNLKVGHDQTLKYREKFILNVKSISHYKKPASPRIALP